MTHRPILATSRFYAWLLIIILLLQMTLAGPAVVRAAQPTTTERTAAAGTNTLANRPQQQPDEPEAGVAVAPPPPDEESPAEALPVPLLLRLTTDRTILYPGDTAQLTVQAWRSGSEEIGEQQLFLDLPAELKLTGQQRTTTWVVPILAQSAIFSTTVDVRLVGGALPFETAVVSATLRTAASATFSANAATTVIGLASHADEPPAAAVAQGVLPARGLVLRGHHGDVTLLIDEDAAAPATTFTYTDGYRATNADLTATAQATTTATITATATPTATTPLTTTPLTTTPLTTTESSAVPTGAIYLPIIQGGSTAEQAQTVAAAEGQSNKARAQVALETVDGVSFVRRWQLDAEEGGTPRHAFARDIQLIVAADWLIDQGIDPEAYTLYSRATADDPWAVVYGTAYDPQQQQFYATIRHFSEYGLGLAQGTVGETLPDVSAFGNDRFIGAATVNYPLALPAGAGGMAPSLSLSYSSATVDSLREGNYKNEPGGYRSQAGLAGIGWSLSAENHIAFLNEGDDPTSPNDDKYTLVLNGTSNVFVNGQSLTESFAKLTPAIDTRPGYSTRVKNTGEWQVTTTDGTRHYFGGATLSPTAPPSDPNQNVMIWNVGQYTQHEVVNKWYLRKSVDLQGNVINYQYQADSRWLSSCGNGWYHQSIRPHTISWGGNEQRGEGPKMQVVFGYENRSDYNIYKRTDACTQSIYSTVRLKTIRVQVYSEGAWRPLREYELSYSYSSGYIQHSMLAAIHHYTFDSSGNRMSAPLQSYHFTYEEGGIHSEVYLQTAENGWGGKVRYQYDVPEIQHCHIDGSTTCRATTYRRRLRDQYIYDGTVVDANKQIVGNWVRTRFGYGTGLYRSYKNEPVEFLGYHYGTSVIFEPNSYTQEAQITKTWFYRNQNQSTDSAIANNPDPRLGRQYWQEIWQPGLTACPGDRQDLAYNRCKMAVTSSNYTALTGSGSNWSATSSYTVRPRWVRQDAVSSWVDGVSTVEKYFFESDHQNGHQFGNLTRKEEWDGSNRLRITDTDYYPNSGAHIVNRPGRQTITDGTGACVADTHYHYDGNGSYTNAPSKGQLTKQARALTACGSGNPGDSDNNWQITAWDYDPYGNQTKETPYGGGSAIETSYDSLYHTFPVARWLSANGAYQETATYYGVNSPVTLTDSRAQWGAIAEWCGVNDLCTRYAYDDYGRTQRQWTAIAKGDPWSMQDQAATVLYGYKMYGANNLTRNVITEWRAPRCYGNFTRKVYNGLGQLLQEQGPSENWSANVDGCNPGSTGGEVDVSYDYDALGNQVRAGVPVATTANYINRATDWNAGYTSTSYDVLGRPKQVVAPNGETTEYKYVGRSTRVTALGRGVETGTDRVLKWTESDALGNLAIVRSWTRPWQAGDTAYAEVKLQHDTLGNLTRVEQPDGIVATMHYDLGGRKDAMVDPDLGNWRYGYDRLNRLTRQTDARGKTTCLYYDSVGRVAGKQFRTDANCPATVSSYDIRYSYDARHGVAYTDALTGQSVTEHSRGQLTQIYYQKSDGYYKNLYYNAQGQLAREQVRIPGLNPVDTRYDYDAYRRPYATQYPDGEIVKANLNSIGLPKLMCSATWNSSVNDYRCTSAQWYVSNASYDEAGRVTAMQFPAGGGLWLDRGYFGWTATDTNYPGSGNGRLFFNRVGTTQSGYDKLNLVYYYDSFGNVKRHYDNSAYNNFSYDHQNRVTSAYGKGYSYDNIGRLTNYEGVTQPVNNSFPAHAIKKSGYSYDANGNLTTRGNQTLTWNHENQLSAISGGGLPSESYLYDDQGMRVKKSAGGIDSYYVNQLYEISGGVATKYYYFGGQRIAMRKNGTLTYLHSDHLGSTVLETVNGNATADQKYFAYGTQRDTGPVMTDHQFTGQKQDATGLMYYASRYYDPSIGAFISPDSIVPDASSIFSYNRFMYTVGNPLNRIDPTGHADQADDQGTPLSAYELAVYSFVIHHFREHPLGELYDKNWGLLVQDIVLGAEAAGGFNLLTYHDVAKHMANALIERGATDSSVLSLQDALYFSLLGVDQEFALVFGQYNDAKTAEMISALSMVAAIQLGTGWGASALGDCSFSAETVVTTSDGEVTISRIKVGDLVFAFDEATGATGHYSVTATIAHIDPVVVYLTLDDEVVKTTPEHPFYVMMSAPWLAVGQTHGRWIPASELAIGDAIRQADGTTGIVQAVEVLDQPQLMYNLAVAEAHTFFVGDGQWLVHNQCLTPNQMNRAIQRGQAPNGIERVDTPKIPGEQLHVHFADDSALNIDGTWKHGQTTLTSAQGKWLATNGWTLPE